MDIAEDVKGFDKWYSELEGFSLRAERFDGDVAWLKAAYAAGARAAIEAIEEQFSEAYDRWRDALVAADPDGVPWAPGSSDGLFEELFRSAALNPPTPSKETT